ncbi:hypothetical protein HDE_01525 [Halotydeus destructor]|nr:hypothetical protein HDE_01525 [Halotydeus destructor]
MARATTSSCSTKATKSSSGLALKMTWNTIFGIYQCRMFYHHLGPDYGHSCGDHDSWVAFYSTVYRFLDFIAIGKQDPKSQDLQYIVSYKMECDMLIALDREGDIGTYED